MSAAERSQPVGDSQGWHDDDEEMAEFWRDLEKFEPLPSLDDDEEGEDG